MELTEQFRRMDSALAGMPEVEIPKMLAALARKYNAAEGLVKVLNGAHEGGKKKRSAKSTTPGSKRQRTSSRDTLAEGDTIELNDSSAAHPTVILHRYDVIEKAWKLRTPDGTVLNGVYKRHSAWRVVPQQPPQPPVQPQQQPRPQVLLLGYNGAEQADDMAELVDPDPEPAADEQPLLLEAPAPRRGRKQPQPPLAVGAKVRLDDGTTATVVEYNSVDDLYTLRFDKSIAAKLQRFRRTKKWQVLPEPQAPQPPAVEECSICTDAMDDPAQVWTLECCRQKIHCGCLARCLHVDPPQCPYCRHSWPRLRRRVVAQASQG